MSKYKRNIGEYTDMEKLAEDIGDLHYETLSELFGHLARKLDKDSVNDATNGRIKLSHTLRDAATELHGVKMCISDTWDISKPFMKDDD